MTAVKREVDELVGVQRLTVDCGWSSHDQLHWSAVDEDTDCLGARDSAVTALDVLRLNDELAAEVTRQYVRTRTLRWTGYTK